MAVTIVIPTPLRQFTGGSSELTVAADTAGAALDQLTTTFPELRRHLYTEQGVLRNFVNVYLGDEDIRHGDGVNTPVKEGDVLMIVPAIAGGGSASGTIQEATIESSLPTLTPSEIGRYSRHLILNEVGMEGQRKLKAARVLMIGTGGLGSPLGLYLAAAGVGTIGLVDFDVVDESNLQRQVLHGTADIGRLKTASARDRLEGINPHIKVETYETHLTSANALQIVRGYDIVVDGTDNFPTRYLVNDACALLGKANVYGSIFRFEGQASVFWAAKGACYRCLYPEPPPPGLVPSCAEGGVLGVLPGIVGSIQANETIKLILGAPGILLNRLLLFDAWTMKFRELKLRKDPACPMCGDRPTIKELIDYEEFCGMKPTRKAPAAGGPSQITAKELSEWIRRGDDIQIIDVREPFEFDIARLPAARLIPLKQVVGRVHEIDPAKVTVVHCKAGIRGNQAIAALREAGFTGSLVNLQGGILAWSSDVDPSVPRY